MRQEQIFEAEHPAQIRNVEVRRLGIPLIPKGVLLPKRPITMSLLPSTVRPKPRQPPSA
jgi:hypothetical protein